MVVAKRIGGMLWEVSYLMAHSGDRSRYMWGAREGR